MEKEYILERELTAEFLRDIADAVEDENQLNISLGEEKLIQPLGDDIPVRIYQDEEGTEIGFRLSD